MALTFNKLEPVRFGEIVAMPVLSQELKLRVQQLKPEADNMEETRNILSECFGEKSMAVKEFMRENFSNMDYIRLQVYLLNGDKGLEDIERRMDIVSTEEMRKAMQKAKQK